MTDNETYGGDLMGYGCCGVGVDQVRNFLTREERIAQQNNFKSISIPAISAGIFGFPHFFYFH